MELSLIADGRCNAVVFWHECQMGPYGTLTSAPAVAAANGTMRTRLGQALQFLPPKEVEQADGEGRIRLMASHNRSRIRFTHAGAGPEPPRRGLIIPYQYTASLDGHHNRTLAAAMRKRIFSYPKTRNLLILHVGSGFGTQVRRRGHLRTEHTVRMQAAHRGSPTRRPSGVPQLAPRIPSAPPLPTPSPAHAVDRRGGGAARLPRPRGRM